MNDQLPDDLSARVHHARDRLPSPTRTVLIGEHADSIARPVNPGESIEVRNDTGREWSLALHPGPVGMGGRPGEDRPRCGHDRLGDCAAGLRAERDALAARVAELESELADARSEADQEKAMAHRYGHALIDAQEKLDAMVRKAAGLGGEAKP